LRNLSWDIGAKDNSIIVRRIEVGLTPAHWLLNIIDFKGYNIPDQMKFEFINFQEGILPDLLNKSAGCKLAVFFVQLS